MMFCNLLQRLQQLWNADKKRDAHTLDTRRQRMRLAGQAAARHV